MSEWFLKRLNFFAGLLCAAALFGLLAVETNLEIKDSDLWLHLASGRFITAHAVIPQTDIFSCTLAGHAWINHEWLFQVLLADIYHLFSVNGLIFLQVAVVGLTFILLFFFRYDPAKQVTRFFYLILVLLIYESRFTIRPDIVSFLFLAVFIILLSKPLNRLSFWILALTQVLWSNMHGFFILGPAVIVLSLFSEGLKRVAPLPRGWKETALDKKEIYHRFKLLAVVLFACALNPYGFQGLFYPFKVLFSLSGDSQVFFRYIQELRHPALFGSVFSLDFKSVFRLAILASFASFLLNRRRVDLFHLLLWVAFLVLSLQAVRNLVFFAVVSFLVFILNMDNVSFSDVFPVFKGNRRFHQILSIVCKALILLWLLHYAGTVTLRGYYDFETHTRKSEFGDVSLRMFPVKAVDFLEKNGVKGNFFNDFNSGAYLLGRMYPDIRVSLDGRTELYGPDYFKRILNMKRGHFADFESFAQKHAITGVFFTWIHDSMPKDMLKYLYDSPQWVLVYFDYDGGVFLRDVPANREMIQSHAIDLSRHAFDMPDLFQIRLRPVDPFIYLKRAEGYYAFGFYEKAGNEIENALSLEPRSVRAYELLGHMALNTKQYRDAFKFFRQAKIIAPDDVQIRYFLALSFYHLGQFKEAQKQCEYLLAFPPAKARVLYLLSRIAVSDNRVEEGMDYFEEAYPIQSYWVEEMLAVADILKESGRLAEAQQIYRQTIQANEGDFRLKDQTAILLGKGQK